MAGARKVTLELSIPISILKEGQYFIVYSPVLDLSTSAKDFKGARERFGEVVHIFFEELLEKRTLDEVLSELGWQKVKKKWSPPAVVSHEFESFRVPISA